MRPVFGTLEWGDKNNGVLTRTERLHFLRNMAILAAREVTDAIRAKLGLLTPVNLELSDLAPPDTRMVKDAEELARDTHAQDLLSHAYRTYYFGAMLAACRKLRYDREAHFAAAILHDIGLTESRIAPLKRKSLVTQFRRTSICICRSARTARWRCWWRMVPSATCLALRNADCPK